MKVIYTRKFDADSLENLPDGSHVIEIDGEEVVGQCCNCFRYIVDSEEWRCSSESDMYCIKCWEGVTK